MAILFLSQAVLEVRRGPTWMSAKCPGLVIPVAASRPCYQPYRVSPFSRTSTIFWPVRYESGVERPVMKG